MEPTSIKGFFVLVAAGALASVIMHYLTPVTAQVNSMIGARQ